MLGNDLIRYTLFRRILQQEIGYFDVNSSGKLLNSLVNDLGRVELIFEKDRFNFVLSRQDQGWHRVI